MQYEFRHYCELWTVPHLKIVKCPQFAINFPNSRLFETTLKKLSVSNFSWSPISTALSEKFSTIHTESCDDCNRYSSNMCTKFLSVSSTVQFFVRDCLFNFFNIHLVRNIFFVQIFIRSREKTNKCDWIVPVGQVEFTYESNRKNDQLPKIRWFWILLLSIFFKCINFTRKFFFRV